MSTELPTIPQIVCALVALEDRHQDARTKALSEAQAAHESRIQALEAEYERQLAREEVRIEALNAVIETLTGQLVMIQGRAQRAQRDSYMLEPQDVFLDAKVNVTALRASELRKAQERAGRRDEPMERGEDQEPAESENGPQEAAEPRLCTKCGKDVAHIMWAQRHLGVFAGEEG